MLSGNWVVTSVPSLYLMCQMPLGSRCGISSHRTTRPVGSRNESPGSKTDVEHVDSVNLDNCPPISSNQILVTTYTIARVLESATLTVVKLNFDVRHVSPF